MEKLRKSKFLALVLCIMMVLSVLPAGVMADEGGTTGGADGETYVAWIGETGYTTLEAAISAAGDGATIRLGEGRFTTFGKSSPKKSLTFEGAGTEKTLWGIGATIPDPSKFGTEYNGDYSFDSCDTITFKNMTLQSSNADYLGFIRINNIVVDGCVVNGRTHYWGYKTTKFTNTTFYAPGTTNSGLDESNNKPDYVLWTSTGLKFTFEGRTFNVAGKTLNVYKDHRAGENSCTVNMKNCNVISTNVPYFWSLHNIFYKAAEGNPRGGLVIPASSSCTPAATRRSSS